MSNSFFQKDIVSIRDFDKQKFETVFDATDKIIKMSPNERRELARGKILGYLFFEPSTRTRLSFEAAMASLGGTSIGIADASSSSAKKGESLADTVRIMALYSDVLVLRH
ncbi:MAG: aspartate carbamoyltransferase, partial [Nitrosopumilaceae archaeon]